MKEVTEAEFYEGITAGKLDVHPTITGRYQHGGSGFTQVWKFPRSPGRKPYGVTESGCTPGNPPRYFLYEGGSDA